MRRIRHQSLTGFLSRLRKNVAGNTLVLVAVAMIPLCAMVGGALDLSRMYLTKVRMQHACDAGALAGRKEMGGGSWDTAAQQAASDYFKGNFRQGAYGTGITTADFSSSGSDVSGIVKTTVPMTLMAMFNFAPKQLTVTCLTAMQLPNTDVMFVLDVTGSMACLPSEGACGGNVRSGSKINVLKNAVKCFYEALAQTKTDASNCAYNTYQGINSDSQLRFGFVPYSSNVNVSQLGLPASYFAKSWAYQSRSKTLDWTDWQNTNTACSAKPANTATQEYQTSGYNNCVVQTRTKSAPSWLYSKTTFTFDTASALAAFRAYAIPTAPAASQITIPGIGTNYADRKVDWDGCIEEQSATTNINAFPNPSDDSTLFAPVLPDVIYLRNAAASSGNPTTNSFTRNDTVYAGNIYNNMANYRYYCPAPAEKLNGTDVWTPTKFSTYVNSLAPVGNTYHDYGMLWGGRLLSPEGMYAAENGATSTGGVIQRHLIFMTDGDAQANSCDYTNYGIAWWDRRTNSSISGCGNSEDANLTNDVNSRLSALCSAVKNEPNTLVWVISFGGTGITSDTKNRLKNCASDDDHFFDATNSTQLNSAFQDIAARISQLRLEQ